MPFFLLSSVTTWAAVVATNTLWDDFTIFRAHCIQTVYRSKRTGHVPICSFLWVWPLINESLLALALESWKYVFRNMIICFFNNPFSLPEVSVGQRWGGDAEHSYWCCYKLFLVWHSYQVFLFYLCLLRLSTCSAAINEGIVAKREICSKCLLIHWWALSNSSNRNN